jgi:hypothetical protein
MFISSNSHEIIVEELRSRIAAQQYAHDQVVAELRNQIAELRVERDFYRRQWTKSRGQAFTAKEEPVPSLPLFEQATEPPFDAGWTADDHMLFRDWARDLPHGVNAEEEWKRLHGGRSPLIELTV